MQFDLINKKDLINYFTELGVRSGMIIELHVSLAKLGYVCGGVETLIDALFEVLGYGGTIIMPLQCAQNSEPSYFDNPAINFKDMAKYRNSMPAFNLKTSETFMMSKVSDNLRRRDKAVISYHPNVAFVAMGKYAKLLCNHQSLAFGLGEDSPLGRLYGLKAHCLLLGVDYSSMTALHLAEYKSEARPIILQGAAIEEDGCRKWKKYLDFDLDSSEFNDIGKLLEEKELVRILDINNTQGRLLRIDTAVDEGIRYFRRKEI